MKFKNGLLKGNSHKEGGIDAHVESTGQRVELEGGEIIVNKISSKKFCEQLSDINQAGGGVKIDCEGGGSGGEVFLKGGKVGGGLEEISTIDYKTNYSDAKIYDCYKRGIKNGLGIKLSSIVSFDSLYDRYKGLGDIFVVLYDCGKEIPMCEVSGLYNGIKDLSSIDIKLFLTFENYKKYEKFKYKLGEEESHLSREAILLHEIQHILAAISFYTFGTSEATQRKRVIRNAKRKKLVLSEKEIEETAYFDYLSDDGEQMARTTVRQWLKSKGLEYIDPLKGLENFEEGGRINRFHYKKDGIEFIAEGATPLNNINSFKAFSEKIVEHEFGSKFKTGNPVISYSYLPELEIEAGYGELENGMFVKYDRNDLEWVVDGDKFLEGGENVMANKQFEEGGKIKRATYRIQNANGTFLNAGTDQGSWLHLEDARKLVNYEIGQRIVEHNGVDVLWEVFQDGGRVFDINTIDIDKEIPSKVFKIGVLEKLEKIINEIKETPYKSDLKWEKESDTKWAYKKTNYNVKDEDLSLELEQELILKNRGVVDTDRINKYIENVIIPKYGDNKKMAKALYQEAKDAYESKFRNEKTDRASDIFIEYLKERISDTFHGNNDGDAAEDSPKPKNDPFSIPNDMQDEIRESFRLGYTTIQEGMISPNRRGIVLTNENYEVRGTYDTGIKPAIEEMLMVFNKSKPAVDEQQRQVKNMKNIFDNAKVGNWNDLPVNWKIPHTPKKVKYEKADWTDEKFMSLLKPFASTDDIRPQMNGVYFNDGNAIVTDAHKLVGIKADKSDSKIHSFKGSGHKEIIDERFSQYEAVIPNKKTFEGHTFHKVDLLKLKTYTECAVDNFANMTHSQVRYEYGDGEVIGFNGKYLIEVVEFFMKLGYTDAVFSFSTNNRAIFVSPTRESFNNLLKSDVFALLMPVGIRNYNEEVVAGMIGTEDLDYNTELSCYFSFTKNAIVNQDNSIVKFDRFLEEQYNGVTKEQYKALKSILPKKAIIPILEYALVTGGGIIASDLSSWLVLPNYNNIPDGIYYLKNNALRLDSDMSIGDYPIVPDKVEFKKLFRGNVYSEIKKATLCLGEDGLRPIFKSVNINTTLKNIYSTDGHRVYKSGIDIKVEAEEIISIEGMKDYVGAAELLGDKSDIEFYSSDRWYEITGGSFKFYGKVNSDRYPNVEGAVIHYPKHSFTVTKEQLDSCHKFNYNDNVIFFSNRIEMVESESKKKKAEFQSFKNEESLPMPHKICDQTFVTHENSKAINSGYFIMPLIVNPAKDDFIVSLKYGFLMDSINSLGSSAVDIYFEEQKKGVWVVSNTRATIHVSKIKIKQAIDSLNLMVKLSPNKKDSDTYITFINKLKI